MAPYSAADARGDGMKWKSNTATGVDRRGAKRVVPMKCLGFTLPRTGTMSLRVALTKLGFVDTYHMSAAFANPPDLILWKEALDAKYHGKGTPWTTTEQWDQLLGNCMVTTDAPACFFVPELLGAYPDAKVILTTRDVDKWFASTDTVLITPFVRNPLLKYIAALDPHFFALLYPVTQSLFYGAFAPTLPDWERNGRDVYRHHHALVKQLVPPDRLLEYRVGEGWDRLCAFLDVPVPDEPFPVVNEGAETDRLVRTEIARALLRAVCSRTVLLCAGLVLGAAVGVKMFVL